MLKNIYFNELLTQEGIEWYGRSDNEGWRLMGEI